jgi:hypothetical protein
LRFRCKSCGRTFNALSKTPMAHLRKKERWLDHAQAMIEGKSLPRPLSCAASIRRPPSAGGIGLSARPPTTSLERSGIVEADETFILESSKARWSDLPRQTRRRGGTARHPGPYQDNIPVLVAGDRRGATFDAVLTDVVRWVPEALA